MLTSSKDDATGAIFHTSHSDSDFQKVYKNNIINYLGSTKNIIEAAISNTNTVLFESEVAIDNTEEYKICQVF